MEKLDEMGVELDESVNRVMDMCSETPTLHNFEQDVQQVVTYCSELKSYLESDRAGVCPIMLLSTEQAIRRIANTNVPEN
uniref:Uncharacterized protein n=1 Tax=Caenorhabditis japonica TaxID=281687 RepID=A0A8R1E6J3_CAEJA